jgi:heptosyltransferase III
MRTAAAHRWLVLRGGAIGDFVATLPALQALRASGADVRVDMMGYPRTGVLAREAGLADRFLSLETRDAANLFAASPDFSASFRDYMAGFDGVISYLHDPDGTVGRNLLAIGRGRVEARTPLMSGGSHAAVQLLEPLIRLGLPVPAAPRPRLALPEARLARARGRIAALRGPVLAIHPGSGSPAKN